MKKIFNRYFILNFLWIVLLSLIPVFHTWGRLPIGGDTAIFFDSKAVEKYLYQWISYHNGLNFAINYFPLYIFHKIMDLFRLDPYQISVFLFFFLSLLSGLGIYKLARLIYGREGLFMLVPVTFYVISPALLNGWHYLYIYSTAPFFIYFVFKIIKTKEISVGNVIWLNVIIFFSSMDLPNPKYLFHMAVILIITVFSAVLFKLINFQLLLKNWRKLIIFLLLSAYLLLPQINFFTQYTGIIPVKAGYKTEGKMADQGIATIDRMVLLHHKGVSLNTVESNQYLSNPMVIFLSYVFIILIILNIIMKKRDDDNYKYDLIFFILIIVFLFFAKGSNPPFGYVYEYMVSNFSALAFLRTTAGAVFFLAIFYAVSLGSFILKTGKFTILWIMVLMVVAGIVNYPYINGEYFQNLNSVNIYTNRREKGFVVPKIYFEIVDLLNNQRIDAKFAHTRSNMVYYGNKWGYFGPNIYFYFYGIHNIGYSEIYTNLANHNIGYVFTDNSSTAPGLRFKYKTGKVIVKNSILQIDKLAQGEFLPHFYTPQKIIVTDQKIDDLYQIDQPDYNIRSAIYVNNKDFKIQNPELLDDFPEEIKKTPVLEFRKINPTKYRIIVHQAKDNFPLVFSENFHKGWKAYLGKPSNFKFQISNFKLNEYKILDGNELDQATKEELISYIDKDWISTLGNKKIDFVSKNFADTIQNDNLPKGDFYETWLAQSSPGRSRSATPSRWPNGLLEGGFWGNKNVMQIPNENHQTVNVYANSWWIEVDKICQESSLCTKNPDGSYDFEMIVEFWPQQVFYIAVIISGAALFLSVLYLTFKKGRSIVQSSL